MKTGKANGPDLILNEFIKCSSSSMSLVIVKLFNKVLQNGKFPKVFLNPEILTIVTVIGVYAFQVV